MPGKRLLTFFQSRSLTATLGNYRSHFFGSFFAHWLIHCLHLSPVRQCLPQGRTATRVNERIIPSPTDRWRPVVNADIKLCSIIFGPAQSGYYPAFKTPKMIDFGVAFDDNRHPNRERKKKREPPHAYFLLGTEGSRPPVSHSY